MASSSGSSSKKSASQQQQEAATVNQFNALREEQRQIGMRISQLEMEAREHALVIDVLSKVAPERRCYRMVGSVLVERTAGDVLPKLASNRDQMLAMVEQMKAKLAEKGRELNDFKEKHGIRVAGERPGGAATGGGGEGGGTGDDKAGGVLVA